MASDERDRNFDKAIARHLRFAAAAGASSPRDSCADAETLAAYHERSLLPEEMNLWKEHIVGCAHCQELLAHLEASDNIPLHADGEVEVLAGTDTRLAAASKTEALPRAAGQPVRALRPSRTARWRWLAPAGAIAAGLFVWMVIHENQPAVLPSSNEFQIAKKQEPPAPEPSLETSAPAGESHPQLTAPKSPSVNDEIASSTRRLGTESLTQRQVAGYAEKAVAANPPAEKESNLRKDGARDSAGAQYLSEHQTDLDAKTAAGAIQQRAEVQSQAANIQSQDQLNANLSRVPGPAPLGQVETSKKAKASPATPAAPPSGVGGDFAVGAATELVMGTDPTWITAPGSPAVWRAGPAGDIQFSRDGGRSWSRQPSGVLVDLLTGSAPSDKVCWIIGRVGAILLTTDGGTHWNLISSPLKEDLTRIQATDSLHATVWNARGTKSYTTSDGGRTWERLPKP